MNGGYNGFNFTPQEAQDMCSEVFRNLDTRINSHEQDIRNMIRIYSVDLKQIPNDNSSDTRRERQLLEERIQSLRYDIESVQSMRDQLNSSPRENAQ